MTDMPHSRAGVADNGVAGSGPKAKREPPPPQLDPSWTAARKLSERRAQLGLSLEQLAERTRIARSYLEALETMNAKLLPGRAYAMAYLRSYAQALGLDAGAIVTQYQAESALAREDDRPQIRAPETRPARERPWLAAAALGLMAGGFVMWRALGPDATPAVNAPVRDVLVDAGEGSGFQTPTDRNALALRTLEIRAVTDARLEVRGPDGTIFFYDTLRAGQGLRPDPGPDWTLHARDGGAFVLLMHGIEIGPLGEAGQPVLGLPVRDIPIPEGADWAHLE